MSLKASTPAAALFQRETGACAYWRAAEAAVEVRELVGAARLRSALQRAHTWAYMRIEEVELQAEKVRLLADTAPDASLAPADMRTDHETEVWARGSTVEVVGIAPVGDRTMASAPREAVVATHALGTAPSVATPEMWASPFGGLLCGACVAETFAPSVVAAQSSRTQPGSACSCHTQLSHSLPTAYISFSSSDTPDNI